MNQKFNDSNAFLLCHQRLGHPGIFMMCRIVQNSNGHSLTSRQILVPDGYTCAACSKGKLIIRPFFTKATFHLDNVGEFSFQAFLDYYMSIGIDVQHHGAHVHFQNGLAEFFIKCLQLIARPLLLKTKLPLSAWGHAIIHDAHLIRLCSTTNHNLSSLQLAKGYHPNISHLQIFGCAVYVPVGPQRRLGIYVGFQSTSIINYIEPLTGEVFTARFADCHFDENLFPPLGGDKPIPEEWREIIWNESSLSYLDPHTKQFELEVQNIIHLQGLAN